MGFKELQEKKTLGVTKILMILIVVSVSLTGCGAKSRTEESIRAYNEEVYEVVSYYESTKRAIEGRSEEILEEIQKEDAEIDGEKIEGKAVVTGATEIDVLRNEFFTSLNAESIRQVILVTKGGKAMYVELIWKDNKLEKGIRREVEF